MSCGGGGDEKAEDRHSTDTLYQVPWKEVEIYLKAAPSPVQVALWLRQEKVPFFRSIPHDPTIAGRYAGLQGAANLGIYLTDMAYAYATQNYQEAYEYLSAVHRLSARYGLDDIFSIERIRSLDKLQDQPDSAHKLLTKYYAEVQDRLEATGQQAILRHMILGGWLESIHITLGILEKEPQREPLSEMILLQKSFMPLLMKLYAVDTAGSQTSREIISHLAALERSMAALPLSESLPPVASVQKGVIQMQFRQKARLTSGDIASLREPLGKLRQFVTQV